MFRSYLKIAVRNLIRHKSFSLLNIFGLSIGMACSILIFLWVQDEMSYDRFNIQSSSIYRVTSDITNEKAAVVPVPMAQALTVSFPEIQNTTRLKQTHGVFSVKEKKFEEAKIFYADSNFFKLFSYSLLKGSTTNQLSQPGGLVITESFGRKYFGNEDPMGKIVVVENDIKPHELIVTGVLKDIPRNSHLQFDALLPFSLYEQHIDFDGSWGNFDVYTYIKMAKEFSPTPSAIKKTEARIFELYVRSGKEQSIGEFSLQPLTDIHLRSGKLLLDVAGQGNIEYVRIFSIVAIFILLIACINFMNLSTAMASLRAKEVGLRKTVGALRVQLIMQFIGEAILLSLVALIIGVCIAWLLLPVFNDLTAKNITFNLQQINIILTLLITSIIVGLISGSYPAIFLSSFKPVKVLKGIKVVHGQKSLFRNGLVTAQFAISVILIICTLIIYNQLQFIRNRDIGYNKENLLYVKMPQVGDLGANYQALKTTLQRYPAINDFTITNYLPVSLTTGTTSVEWPGKDPAQQTIFPHLGVDENFIQTFKMQLLAGRFFPKDFKGDEKNYVVNETALRIMNITTSSAIGKEIVFNGRKGEIIGVVKDFNFKPIHATIEPLILKYNSSGGYLVIRTTSANIKNSIATVKKIFTSVYAGYPFSYGFLDEDLSKLYTTEQRMGKIFDAFAILSVVISCLGLFGLATFTIQRRIREIGIRKVLGASISGIVQLLSKDFLKPVILASVIAFPVAWWAMTRWLENFAYHITISGWIFIAATLLALGIALLTICFQAIKAAMANPVKSLRSE